MQAFFIFQVDVKNPEKFMEYAKAAPATMAPYGGKIVARGKKENEFAGSHSHKAAAILEFPDIEKAHAWYASDAYQALIPNRDEAADVSVTSYINPDA